MKYLLIILLLAGCNSGPKNKTFSKAELDSAMMKETHIKVDISHDFGGAHDKYQAYLVDTSGDIKVGDSILCWGGTTRHLKKKKHAIGQRIVGTAVSESFSCPLDTMRGIMMWNRPDDYGNDGNTWDNGYYVGLCGPALSMPVDSVIFFAGVMPRTYSMANCRTCPFHTYNEEYTQSGKFYDSQWHQIPTKTVFAFIILRH